MTSDTGHLTFEQRLNITVTERHLINRTKHKVRLVGLVVKASAS